MILTQRKEWLYMLLVCFLVEHISAEIKNNNYATGQITWSGSLDQNIKGTYSHLRTKVECGGQCLLTASCSAFRFTDDNSCQLYDATYLYKDKTDNPGTSVYVQDNLWYQRVHTTWTLWNAWSSCTQICDTGTRFRDRQCPGSNPRGRINKPSKTAQYGGERDCAGDKYEQPNCNEHSCSPIDVTHTSGSKCAGQMFMYNAKIVEIKSPNYPDKYESGHNCAWEAKIPTTLNRYNRICFHTPHLETESGYDYIQILDGGTELQKWSGDTEKSYYATPGSSPLTVKFKTDGSVQKIGWRLWIWPC